MKSTHRTSSIALAALALMASAAHADGPEVTFQGYGTLAATYADTDQAEYRSSWRQDKGSRGKVDLGVDSRLAGQANVKFNDTFSAAGQVLAIRRDGKDKVDLEWLYGQVQLHPEVSVRLGRLALPAFMLSDVRTVGYAQHWLRTPPEAYLQFPVTSFDGVQLLYRTTWEGIKFTVQPSFGSAKAKQYFDGGPIGLLAPDADFKKLRGINLSAEKGDWLFRLGQVVTGKASLDYHLPFIPSESFKDTFTSVGAQYDNGDLLVMAEYIDRKTDTARFDTKSYYVSAGYRFGSVMPYATYSHLKSIGSVIAGNPPSKTTAFGVRWDVMSKVAVKAQMESSSLSGQQFMKVDLTADKTQRPKVYTLGVDFVF